MTDHREQNSSCPVTWEEEPRGFLTEWEATPLEPTEDAGNMLAPMWLFDHVAACIRDGKATEEMAQNIECLRGGMEAQAARIAELEARVRQQAGFMEAWKDDLTQMALDAKEQRARAEAAEARERALLACNNEERKALVQIVSLKSRLKAAEAALSEMTRRRDEWRKKAEGYDAVRLALREKVGSPWPPHMSRLLWAGIAADEKKRADDAEAALAEAEARSAALVAGAYEAAALVCDETAQEFFAEEDQDFCAPIAVRMASLAAEIRALAKKEADAVKGGTISTGPHCDCGMIGPCMFEKCRHPLAANNGEAGE